MSQVIRIEVEAAVEWKAMRGASNGTWIGVCDALNLSVEAGSEDELRSLIPETMHLLLIDLALDNEFDAYLRERGWRSTGLPDRQEIESAQFQVPWHLMMPEGKYGSARSYN